MQKLNQIQYFKKILSYCAESQDDNDNYHENQPCKGWWIRMPERRPFLSSMILKNIKITSSQGKIQVWRRIKLAGATDWRRIAISIKCSHEVNSFSWWIDESITSLDGDISIPSLTFQFNTLVHGCYISILAGIINCSQIWLRHWEKVRCSPTRQKTQCQN